MNYRPDIDGLRAIAILLVLIYHGGLPFFPSGFIGVDIFFVISGFLITGIIHQSLEKGHFSFVEFYNRRLWRLQPVFVCLLVTVSLLTLVLFLPDDLIQYDRSARKTSLFLSNLFFNRTTTGYFSPDVLQLPLLHTWSLSIEWQCYLMLPIALYLLKRALRPQLFQLAIFGLCFMFLCLAMHGSTSAPVENYYQFSSRIFEFLMGACISLTPINNVSINKHVLNILGGVSCITILYVASLKNILPGYPNGYAFIVCCATGTLLALGSFRPKQQLVVRLLSLKPFVFIGLISYSLYIWHWPIFSLLRYQSIVETPGVLCLAYSAAFALAYLSWRYIEVPARKFKNIKFQYTVASLLLLPILLTHTASWIIKNNMGFPQRFNQELVTIYQQLDHYSSPQRPLCIDKNNADDAHQCQMGSNNADSKKGLLIGDSFSNHYWGFMDTLGQSANVSILAQGTSSCIALPGIMLFDWAKFKNRVHEQCYEQTKKYYQMIQENHYDFVILGQIWPNYVSDSIVTNINDKRSSQLARKRIDAALDKALQIIVASGAKPLIMNSTAVVKENFHDCFFKHIKLHQPYHSQQCDFKLALNEHEQWMNHLFEKMKTKYPQLVIIDPKEIQCPKGVCVAALNGIPVYRDIGHITDYASYQMGKLYLETFDNPLNLS
jgi:peptidoglycan/LPS O-acetylase OafA/YrhL